MCGRVDFAFVTDRVGLVVVCCCSIGRFHLPGLWNKMWCRLMFLAHQQRRRQWTSSGKRTCYFALAIAGVGRYWSGFFFLRFDTDLDFTLEEIWVIIYDDYRIWEFGSSVLFVSCLGIGRAALSLWVASVPWGGGVSVLFLVVVCRLACDRLFLWVVSPLLL
jgi:hypothetical protein